MLLAPGLGGSVDCFADAPITTTTAQIAVHELIDVCIRRLRLLREQGGSGHYLSCLTITALWHIVLDPGDLQRMQRAIRLCQTLDGRYLNARHVGSSDRARAHSRAIHMHSTGAAESGAASEFGADEAEMVTQHPQQRRRRIQIALDN